ncbi:hypothetical protein [Xanthomonas axonopodis]
MRDLHADGDLGGYAFDDDARVPTLGYAIYLAYPQASEARLYRVLQDADYRSQSTLSVPWYRLCAMPGGTCNVLARSTRDDCSRRSALARDGRYTVLPVAIWRAPTTTVRCCAI